MKITEIQSEEIYRLATDPKNKLSNCEIGRWFGISEALVRYHIKRQSQKLNQVTIANSLLSKSLDNYDLNVRHEALEILSEVRQSITQAKASGSPPERLAGLYSTWLRSLELAAELLGQRTPSASTSQGGSVIQIIIGNPTIPPKRILATPPEDRTKEPELRQSTDLKPPGENYKNEVINTAEQADKVLESKDVSKHCTCFDNGAEKYRQYVGTKCLECGGIVQ